MATIRDVARVAGVSIGTVSNVINNIPTVSEENQKRVREAIVSLNYVCNQAARRLHSSGLLSIGLVIPDITNPFYPEIARGAEDAARSNGCTLVLCNKDRSAEIERSVLNILIGQNVSGILLFKTQLSPSEISRINSMRPIVLMDADRNTYSEFDCVQVDDETGMRISINHVYEMGHRRIGYISGLKDSYSSNVRLQTFLMTMKELGCELPEGYLQYGNFKFDGGSTCVERMLNLTNPPTAVIAANDLTAIGAIYRATELGVRVPADLSVVGYDDVPILQYRRPALTTVWHPKYEMGQAGAQLLFNRIQCRQAQQPLEVQSALLTPRFVRRESLAAPRNSGR